MDTMEDLLIAKKLLIDDPTLKLYLFREK